MEESEINKIYAMDKKRLLNYYERIKKQFNHLDHLQQITTFLNNQSIGTSFDEVLSILEYFSTKIKDGKNILDFAFEWIKAQKLRLLYKIHLGSANYPKGDFELAVDDCISAFFLEYDKYIRKILKQEIQEYDIAALFEVFFIPYETKNLNLKLILKRQKQKVPTIYDGTKKIKTRITTLRSGLSQIIINDYKKIFLSKIEKKPLKTRKKIAKIEEINKDNRVFDGLLIESMVKSYCINKSKILPKEIEKAIDHFLSSYFEFDRYYKYENFKENLIKHLGKSIFSGLTEKLRKSYSLKKLSSIIIYALRKLNENDKKIELDGLTWKDNLLLVLKEGIVEFIDDLFEPNLIFQKIEKWVFNQELNAFFDLNLNNNQYREKLEAFLTEKKMELLERLTIIRNKTQEFKSMKRKKK